MSILTVALTVLPSDARDEQRKTRKEIRKEQRMEEVHSLLTSGRYEIVVSKAFPMSGRMINLTSKYSLQVRQDTLVFLEKLVHPDNPCGFRHCLAFFRGGFYDQGSPHNNAHDYQQFSYSHIHLRIYVFVWNSGSLKSVSNNRIVFWSTIS